MLVADAMTFAKLAALRARRHDPMELVRGHCLHHPTIARVTGRRRDGGVGYGRSAARKMSARRPRTTGSSTRNGKRWALVVRSTRAAAAP